MSKQSKRRRAKEGPSRPSNFFIIALVLGLIFLVMLFVFRPDAPPPSPAVPSPAPASAT